MNRFLRTGLTFALISLLGGCGKLDRSQPYEYIQIHTYSMTTSGLKLADVSSLVSPVIKWDANFFEIGSGKCEKKLGAFKDKELRFALRAWNLAITEHQMNQRPAVAFHMQCIASIGTDERCARSAKEAAQAIADPMQHVDYLFAALPTCKIRRPVGQPRTIQLND